MYNDTVFAVTDQTLVPHITCNMNDLPAIFFPRYFNRKGEAYGTILPEELLEYYKSHDKSKLSNNAWKVLENIREDDNPIFAIGQPKKK